MFEAHSALQRTPFSRDIPVHSLYLTGNHQEALSRLRYTAQRRLVMLLTGNPGVGKSTILRKLKDDLDATQYEVLYLNQAGATLRSFYTDILGQLRMEPPYSMVKARALTAKALLEHYQVHHRTPVLLLDEAQEMADELLDSVRGLLNYDYDAFSPFALILVGTRKLARRISLQRHEALTGRVELPFELRAFTQEETVAYVWHQLTVAGATRPIFTESALRKLHQATSGNARTINKTATLCLMSAYLQKQQLIDDDLAGQIIASELGGMAS